MISFNSAFVTADEINLLLGQVYQCLEADKTLANQVRYRVRPKVSRDDEMSTVYHYHGVDEESQTLLNTYREEWMINPALFIGMMGPIRIVADPVVYAAYHCRRLIDVDLWTELLRRCYCIFFSQLQKRCGKDVDEIAAQLQQIEPNWKMQGKDVTQLQDAGSRYELLEQDLGEGVTFVLGPASLRRL